jgi:predicted Zn finger-like uncharacterized protein
VASARIVWSRVGIDGTENARLSLLDQRGAAAKYSECGRLRQALHHRPIFGTMSVGPVPQGAHPVNDAQNQFIAVCPECSTLLKVNVNKLGQNVRCSQCHHTFVAGEAIDAGSRRAADGPAPSSTQASAEVERIDAVCPGCQASLHVRRAYIGNEVRCKYCNQVFQVQDPADIRSTTAQVPSAEGPVSIQSEHERLYVAHNLLQADHERLKGECTELRENLDRVTAELEAIRAALGTIAPHEVGTLADERESLAAEVHQLRDEIHALLSVQSERDQLAAERQRWDADLTLARSECENVTSQLRDRDNQLAWARAEYERLKADSSDETEAHAEPSRTVVPMPAGENSDFAAELEELRAQFAEVNERLEHAEHLNHEMGAMLQGMGIRWQPSWA